MTVGFSSILNLLIGRQSELLERLTGVRGHADQGLLVVDTLQVAEIERLLLCHLIVRI